MDAGLNVKSAPKSWLDAFDLLKELIRQSEVKKKVIFIDEMPWMYTKREMKYYSEEVSLDEEEEGKIQNRINRVRQVVDDEGKAVQAILVTTKGLHRNGYSDLIQNTVTMDALFERVL